MEAVRVMRRMLAFLSRLMNSGGWRDISTAPFDCAIELAIIDGTVGALQSPFLRQGNGWIDATTLKPVAVSATHWRYWQPGLIPACCC